MNILKDRRAILLAGAAVAVIAGLGAAVMIALGQNDSDDAPPPAAQGGLVVQAGREAVPKLDPARPLRCFVGGRLVGEMPVADCAKKNGVAFGSLSVGVDSTGSLAASATPAADLTPPPPPPPPVLDEASADADEMVSDADPAEPGGQPCWGREGGDWSRQPSKVSLNTCIQSLFAGQCVRPGGAAYGRWGDKTLRLVLGRVEISADGRNFRTLIAQEGACGLPDVQ